MYAYDYDFDEENEIILEELPNMPVDFNKQRKLVNIVITDENVLFFYDIKKDGPLRANLIQEQPIFELVDKVNIKSAEFINIPTDDDTTIYLKEKEITVYNLNLIKIIKN